MTELQGEALETLVALVNSLPGMMYRCRNDRDWTMEFVSSGSLGVTGYPPETFVAPATIDFASIQHPDDRAPVWDAVQAAVAEHRSFAVTYRILPRGGDYRWVWEKGEGVFDQDGNLLWLAGYITDIDALKCSEAALAQREALISEQAAEIEALSAPILEIAAGVLVLPVIGQLSAARGARLREQLLAAVARARATAVLVDITGLANADQDAANFLATLPLTTRLLGATCILTGVQPPVARILLNSDLTTIVVARSLREGLRICLRSESPNP